MDKKAMFQLSYGLYVLTTKDDSKANGCIINTAVQQTSEPNCISITVNKQNYTEQMLQKTDVFNISVIDETAEFSLFQHFGFQSGRETDKFADFSDSALAANGVPYITKGCNSYLSAEIVSRTDLGSHTLFLAKVTDGVMLSDAASMTYTYYHANVKPKPQAVKSEGKVWVCKICGYVYDEAKEGVAFEDLPADWVCPLCKHPKSDFELA
ncbi:MAG: flavin reductase [Lachnospiraceae bacterium]|nr:flavin reductase [Lachnospiraceae bacterium]